MAPLLAEHWTRTSLAQQPDFSDLARNLLAFVPRFLELLQPSQMIILSTGKGLACNTTPCNPLGSPHALMHALRLACVLGPEKKLCGRA